MIDLLMGRVKIDGRDMQFTRYETVILYILKKHFSVDIQTFHRAIWGERNVPKSFGVQMWHIRNKLKNHGIKIVFCTETKRYRLTEPERIRL